MRQMAQDGLREPPAMLPIAMRDYLRFGVLQSLSLFRAMTGYPTLANMHFLKVPTLVVAGTRDPLVRIGRAFVLASLPHVSAVVVPGAHALNFSDPELIAELIDNHLQGRSWDSGPIAGRVATGVDVYHAAREELPRRGLRRLKPPTD
jgi:pimeloyl-ACP methyl ester carboxylesterase